MMKIAMSTAAAGLVRALLLRAGVAREAVLLTQYRSVEWHSLTFAGERHELGLRIPAPGATATVARLLDGIEEAEFDIAGHILADIVIVEAPTENDDGSVSVGLEALTIAA